MRLYRAVCYDELADIVAAGFRPGPPSFQGKWFAGSADHAAEWGRRLFRLGAPPYHLIEVEIADEFVAELYHREWLDRIGPAWYVDEPRLANLRFVREVPDVTIDDAPGDPVRG